MKKTVMATLLVLGILIGLTGCGTYEIRFDTNGGTKISGELLQEVKKGEDAEPPVVERDGYKFMGWDHDPTNVTSNMVIAANWERAYKIVFDPDGGTVTLGDAVQELLEGAMPSPPVVTKMDPAHNRDMTFTGWSPEVFSVNGDATYTAQWTLDPPSKTDLYKQVAPSVVKIVTYDASGVADALGSGFFTDDAGTVVTNYHVVQGAHAIKITLNNGGTYDVTGVYDYDKTLDLALLETNAKSVPLLSASETPETGEAVYAVGNPLDQDSTFTNGMVSTASRRFDDVDVDYIQHTAPISGGNSGGPLVNQYGDVVGVNSMSLKDAQNMNYAINIHELEKLDKSNRISMQNFFQTTNAKARWDDRIAKFTAPASSSEKESNDSWLKSNKLTLGEWTAGSISDEEDVDCFFVGVESPRRVTFELVPNLTSEAEELVVLVARYAGEGEVDTDTLTTMETSSDYSYGVEKACVLDVTQPGVYCVAVTHVTQWDERTSVKFTGECVYLIRAS